MENQIKNIDLINAYLNNELSEIEKQTFEKKIESDSEFKTLYNEQLAILGGISRVDLKAEINAARQSYVRAKWMKYSGVLFGAILISTLLYNFIFKTETPQVVEPRNNNEIEVVSDSEIVEKPSEEKIEEEMVVVKQSESESIYKVKTEKKQEITSSKKTTRKDVIIKEAVIETAIVKEPEPIAPELISFFKSVKKAPQIIEVNTEKDFTVTCKEGTVLTIPAQSFIDAKTGKLARGKINLEVTEYYKLSDMLLGNLTTKSNDKQLETGGMLYLDANKKGKKLKLKSGKRIKMAFNNKGKKNMQLFSGEESSEGVNWKLENTQNTIESIFEEGIYDNKLRIKEMMLDSTFIVTDEFEDSIASYKEQKLIREIDKGNFDKKIIIRKPLLEIENSPFKIHKTDSISRGGHIIRRPLDLHTRMFQGAINGRMSSTKDHRNKFFETINLGWINCDRFVNSKKRKIKYKLKIKNADRADVKMVFKSVSSILPSKRQNDDYDFGKLPIDEEITIIAIKEKDGKLFLSIQDTKTNIKPKIDFDFKEVTIQELKGELETLNNTFN